MSLLSFGAFGPLLRRAWPLALALALIALLWWRISLALDDAHRRGELAERNRWEQAAARAARHAARVATERQEQADRADTEAAQTIDKLNIVEGEYAEKVRILYRDRVDAPCIDADGVRLIRAADAARAAAAAAGGGAGSVPATGTGGEPWQP